MAGVNIPQPSQPVIDFKTGYITREWYRFFVNPVFQSVNLSGVLAVSSGGTGITSGVSGGVLAFTGAGAIASSGLLTQFGPLIGGGAGATPTAMAAATDGQSIVGQSGTAPLWKTLSGDVSMLKTGAVTVSSVTGVTSGAAAAAGKVGEVISSVVASGAAVSLSTGTTANVTSIALTAGDWDVTGVLDLQFGATTSYTNLAGGISLTSATLGAQDSGFDFETPAAVPTNAKDMAWVLPTVQINVSGNTTVYLVAQATFTVSTLKAYGTIRARRIR